MMKILENKEVLFKIKKYCLIVLGFLFCQNILVPLKIGNTPFNISLFLLPIFIVLIIIFDRQRIIPSLKKIPLPLYMFYIVIIFSIIPALILKDFLKDISPFYKGLLFYVISSIVPVLVGIIANKEERDDLIFGVLIGFLANSIISIVVHVAFYLFGYTLGFTSLFRNSSFFEPNYFASAQGMFLEPSHLAGFLFVSFYLLFWYYKEPFIRILITALCWVMFILYKMGNFPIFIVSQLFFFAIFYKQQIINFFKNKIFISKRNLIVFFLVVAVVLCSLTLICVFALSDQIAKVFNEVNPFSDANKDRYNSLLNGLSIYKKHLFGVGFNLSGKAIEASFPDSVATATAHSYLLRIFIELGIIGAFVFVFYFVYLVGSIVQIKNSYWILAFAVFFGMLFSFLDGPTEPYLYFAIGIGCCDADFSQRFDYWKDKIFKRKQNA